MGDRAGSVLAQSCNSVVSTDDGAGAGGEELLEEEQPAPTTQQRIKSFLRKNWRNILVLMCLCVTVSLCAIAFSLMAPFFPKEAYDKGASKGVIGFIYGAPPLVVVILSPLLGYVLPFVGISWYILVGLLLVGTSYVLLGFVIAIPSTWGFIMACILLRVAEGAGTAMFYTATYSTFPNLFPKSVNLLVGTFLTSSGFGFTIGRPLGGFLYHVGGYRFPFLLLGAFIILFSLPCTLFIRIWPIKVEKARQFLPWRVIFGIISDLFFIVLGLTIIVAYMSLNYQSPILEIFLYDKFQLGPIGVSWVFFALSPSHTICAFIAGIVTNKFRSVFISVCGLVVVAAALLLMGIQDYIHYWKLWVVYVSFITAGVGGPFAAIPIYSRMITISDMHGCPIDYMGQPCSGRAREYIRNRDSYWRGDETFNFMRRYLICETDSKNALVSFVSGIVSASACFGQYLGPVLGGVLSDYVSFPITSAILGCIALAQALLLTGVHLIHKYTSTRTRTPGGKT